MENQQQENQRLWGVGQSGCLCLRTEAASPEHARKAFEGLGRQEIGGRSHFNNTEAKMVVLRDKRSNFGTQQLPVVNWAPVTRQPNRPSLESEGSRQNRPAGSLKLPS